MDLVARIIVLLFWGVWLTVAFSPALLFAKRCSDREMRRRQAVAEQHSDEWQPPLKDRIAQPLIGLALAVGGFFLAYAMLGDPEVQSVIIYQRIV